MQKNQKNIIPIFFAVDNNYAPFLAVSLQSMLDHASTDYFYEVYVLTDNMDKEYQEGLNTLNSEKCQLHYVDVNERIQAVGDKLHTRDYYSGAIYYRLFIADLFQEYDKALYLDADIVVLGDIAQLYQTPIDDKYLGVISDDVVASCDEFREYVKDGVGSPVPYYFNSGILVMNLKKMREEDLFGQFKSLFTKVKFIIAPDQDYLNVLCRNQVVYVDSNWNKTPQFSKKEEERQIQLIHYKLTQKPWHYPNMQFGEYFWHYAKQTFFYELLVKMRDQFTPLDAEKDFETEILLRKNAVKETKRLLQEMHLTLK
ncbi:MAG: glycosyltransferase family 8 protein [Anaeroplasma bactoclasticum]|nr:glycosyltransferase family 8 protein [Anaeroplasma bactoclasticum]